LIGIGDAFGAALPHHRAYGSVHGGSIRSGRLGTSEAGQTEFVEVVVAHGLLHHRVIGDAPGIQTSPRWIQASRRASKRGVSQSRSSCASQRDKAIAVPEADGEGAVDFADVHQLRQNGRWGRGSTSSLGTLFGCRISKTTATILFPVGAISGGRMARPK
jgi:hypothetical protein